MPEETSIAIPAADAPVSAPATEAAPHKMTVEEAHALLNAGGDTRPPPPALSPFTEGDGPNALLEDDPMDALASAEPDPLDAEVEPETAPAAEETEAPLATIKDEQPAISADADGRKRINILRTKPDGSFFFSARDRAIMNESAEAGISLAEAEKQLFGGPETPTAEKPPTETAKARTSTDLMAEIGKIKAQRREARAAYDTDKASDLDDQLADLTIEYAKTSIAEVQAEKEELQQKRQDQTNFEQGYQASCDAAVTAYPQVSAEGSALNTAVAAEKARLQRINPSFFNDQEWPETLAAKVATRLGIAPVIPAKAAAAAPAKPVAPLRVLPNANAPARRATPVPSPGAVSGAIPTPDPIAALSQELKDAKERRDGAAINAVIEKINRLGRPRAA